MKRVLVVDDHLPFARRGYGFPRAKALLASMIQLGYRVDYLPLQTVPRVPILQRDTRVRDDHALCQVVGVRV